MSKRSSHSPHSRRALGKADRPGFSPEGHKRGHRAPEPSLKGSLKPRGDLVMGRNCLEELLRHAPDRLREVFVVNGPDEAGSSGARLRALVEQLRECGVPLQPRTRRDLDEMVGSDSHQGVVGRVAPRIFLTEDDLVHIAHSRQSLRILALDGVLDPHNFGAVLRAAECFGVDAVVWSKNRSAPLGPVVSKVSVGASELLPLCPVSNLHRVLELLKKQGVWLVGTLLRPDAVGLDSFEFPDKCAVVMGSEGEGIQQLIERSLDFHVMIPMDGAISSLNVSQATAVVLGELSKQHRRMDKKGSLK